MKRLLSFFLLAITTLLFLELFIRIAGEAPLNWRKEEDKIKCSDQLFEVNEKFGYLYAPGEKQVILNNALTYDLSVDAEGFRNNLINRNITEQTLAIFGCSFFGGMGVNDEDVVSAKLQSLIRNYSVSNYAIPGHGMNLQYLKLKELIQSNEKPEIVVFEVASFHLSRNAGAFRFLKNFANIQLRPTYYLCSRLSEQEDLEFYLKNVEENISFLDYCSAFYHYLKVRRYDQEYSESYLLSLENRLIEESYLLCKENNIEVLFMVITDDSVSDSIVLNMDLKAIPYLVSAVDYKKNEYNLNPYDQHPNAYAHQIYAEEIFKFIENAESN